MGPDEAGQKIRSMVMNLIAAIPNRSDGVVAVISLINTAVLVGMAASMPRDMLSRLVADTIDANMAQLTERDEETPSPSKMH